MASITYDSTEILNTTYAPRFVKHESDPEREIQSFVPTREDGEVLVSERFGTKRIILSGILSGSDQDDLEGKIDAFKELFSRLEKNLDIEWEGGTRRYVATCERHDFDRDHFNIAFVPWTATFIVLSGEGKDTSETLARDEEIVGVTTPGTDAFTLSGSKPPRPVITIEGANFNSVTKGIEYKNTDTGERIVVTRDESWPTVAVVTIDCEKKRVDTQIMTTVEDGPFYGVFPKFRVGTNNVQISAGDIVNQKSPDDVLGDTDTSSLLNGVNDFFAQGFVVPYRDVTFQGITVVLDKALGSPGDVTIRVETDADGEPSGNLADTSGSGSTMTISSGDIGAKGYVTGYTAAPFTLEANTKYWIVVSAAGVDGSNRYDIYYALTSAGIYTKGVALLTTDAGGTWTDGAEENLAFRVLFGGKAGGASVLHTVAYKKTYL